MAKQRSQALVTSLATDAELLMDFLKNPDRVLDEFNIQEPLRQQIKNAVAHEITTKLWAAPTAFAYYVYLRE